MKLSEKAKKYLAISGGVVICVGLIAAISLQFNKVPAGEDTLPEKNPGVVEIVVDPSSLAISPEEPVTEETKVIVQPNTEMAADSTESSQPVDTRPAQTDQTEQSIQPEVTKPAEPSQEVKKDATQKPDGTKVETPPAPVAHEEVVQPTETESARNQPQGGDVQDGKTYLPGFGYIENSGSNQENYAEDMFENGNKIGNMD